MLENDRLDISEGIDVNKSNDESKECEYLPLLVFFRQKILNIFVMDVMI